MAGLNKLQMQVFGRQSAATTYNTYIGGVSSVITNSSELASFLTIPPASISDFEIYGSNIRCNINANYSINNEAFNFIWGDWLYNIMTHYVDLEGRCLNLVGKQNFQGQSNLDFIFLPNLSGGGISGVQVFRFCIGLTVAYFYGGVGFVKLGGSTGNNGVFGGSASLGLDLFIKDYFQTNNGGSPDGDISVRSFNSLTYLANNTIPAAVQAKIDAIVF